MTAPVSQLLGCGWNIHIYRSERCAERGDFTSGIGGEAQGFFRRIGITGQLAGILMVIFGIMVIVFPLLIAWLIGLYLIVAGILQLAGHVRAPPAG